MPAAHPPSFLERRRKSARQRLALSTFTAVVMHGTLASLVAFSADLLGSPPQVVEYVAVPVIPASALGLPAAEPPRPEPAAQSEPETPVKAAPIQPDRPILPDEKAPGTERSPAPRSAQPKPASQTPQRRGSSSGSATGTSSADVAGFDDPDFVYGYYLDQMVGSIRRQWVRPVIGGEVTAVIYFRIHKDGRVSGARIERSSGYSGFDMAALRAVQSASPLPPLPSSYRKSSLGVNLIVR